MKLDVSLLTHPGAIDFSTLRLPASARGAWQSWGTTPTSFSMLFIAKTTFEGMPFKDVTRKRNTLKKMATEA
jgi:hypothetical protein